MLLLAGTACGDKSITTQEAPAAPVREGDTAEARQMFAETFAAAAKAEFPKMTVRIDHARFVLDWEINETRGHYSLGRSWSEYLTLPTTKQAPYIKHRAAMMMGPDLPATFAEAEPKLVAVVRERISHEIGRIVASHQPHVSLRPPPPHVPLTDELWGVIAYETAEQFYRLDANDLVAWGVTFEQVWPAALKRLELRSGKRSMRTVNGVVEIQFGDANDSARLLVPSTLGLSADSVVAIPKEDLVLAVETSNPTALRALADRVVAEWDKGSQNLRLLRIAAGTVSPFLPATSDPLFSRFVDLRASANQRDEDLQRDALKNRFREDEDAPFVASVMRIRNTAMNDELSFVVHSEDTPSLLPRAEWVVFRRVDLVKKTVMTLGCGRWEAVHELMKTRWKVTPLWPPRWLATDLPTAAELKRLGCAQPTLALDLNVARPTQ